MIFHTSFWRFFFIKLRNYTRHLTDTQLVLLWYKICVPFVRPFFVPLSQYSKTSNISFNLEWHKYIWIFWIRNLKILISLFWSKMPLCASCFFPHPLYWPLFLFTRLKCHFSSCSNSALHFHNFLLYYILFEEIQHFCSIHVCIVCCKIYRNHMGSFTNCVASRGGGGSSNVYFSL